MCAQSRIRRGRTGLLPPLITHCKSNLICAFYISSPIVSGGNVLEFINANEPQYHARSIYIDVELTCWEGTPPLGMKQEIIEIGITEMNLITLEITGEASHFVRPKRWEISSKCTDITGITTDDIRQARSFPTVLDSLTEQFAPSRALCCTWGDDASLIAAACQGHGLKTPLRNLLDLSQLFQGLFLLKQRASLQSAVEMLGLGFEGVPYGALADARNTAGIHAAIIRRMRREPDPPLSPVSHPEDVFPISTFAEKLQRSLQKGK
jgi:inhibitor of KinA sporulation pathway (predicted exonuclease)